MLGTHTAAQCQCDLTHPKCAEGLLHLLDAHAAQQRERPDKVPEQLASTLKLRSPRGHSNAPKPRKGCAKPPCTTATAYPKHTRAFPDSLCEPAQPTCCAYFGRSGSHRNDAGIVRAPSIQPCLATISLSLLGGCLSCPKDPELKG